MGAGLACKAFLWMLHRRKLLPSSRISMWQKWAYLEKLVVDWLAGDLMNLS